MENTVENNKLIAEFMGLNYVHEIAFIWETLHDLGHRNKDVLNHPDSYKHYHNSWDELMPVIEKIKSDDFFMNISHIGTAYVLDLAIDTALTTTCKIYNVYCKVVEFIQWYNANK